MRTAPVEHSSGPLLDGDASSAPSGPCRGASSRRFSVERMKPTGCSIADSLSNVVRASLRNCPLNSVPGEDNADAHLKRQIMGREVVVAITKGKLDFVRGIKSSAANFDGATKKRALVKIIGE